MSIRICIHLNKTRIFNSSSVYVIELNQYKSTIRFIKTLTVILNTHTQSDARSRLKVGHTHTTSKRQKIRQKSTAIRLRHCLEVGLTILRTTYVLTDG